MFNMTRFILLLICTSVIFAPLTANAGQIQRREVRQEQRIYHGVRNYQISPREYRKLEQREAAINAQRQRYLRVNQGRLTPAQYRQLNQRLDRNSRVIYRYKHN
ncbi:MAG TPA: hypothetical protein VK203_10515 [Nostocaceae cyanobacterium]|nr:hypothetical protein [Nostocaceae cyanobacterium]